ncbi:hypothetical protein ABT124_44060 [Streptomyces sp. NPDC001982]|uniref:hypothetical protein n=1 Tax=Streptomyces sp. NPDC001982 TaxID=3154405 RepID=UPI00331CAA22
MQSPEHMCDVDARGGRSVTHDAGLRCGRDTVEHLVDRLKDRHGTGTCFDRTPDGCLVGLELRVSMIRVGDLLQAAD